MARVVFIFIQIIRKKMKYVTKKIKHCLLCKNKKLKKVFSLGNLFVSNFVEEAKIKKGSKAPLTLMYCNYFIEIGQ